MSDDPTGPSGPASFNREPLWWIAAGQGIIQAIFILLDSFHVPITSAQQAAITGLFLVLGTAWGRSKVWAPVNEHGQPVAVVPKAPPDDFSMIAAHTPPSPEILHVESEMPKHKKTDAELMKDYLSGNHGLEPPPKE